MNGTIKLLGLLMLFAACCCSGFSKAARLSARKRTLEELLECLDELDARLRYEGTERLRLLREAFGKSGIIVFDGGAVRSNRRALPAEDLQPLEGLLDTFGSGDTAAEHNKIMLCRRLSEARLRAAENDCAVLGRLYRALGACAGAACCLILI